MVILDASAADRAPTPPCFSERCGMQTEAVPAGGRAARSFARQAPRCHAAFTELAGRAHVVLTFYVFVSFMLPVLSSVQLLRHPSMLQFARLML